MAQVHGIHHVTAIAGDAQENLAFYTSALGMRLVKKSVNQDDPGTYHLFYADAVGHPGTDVTFFPWPRLSAGRKGVGLANELSLAVPPGSLDYWAERLGGYEVSVDEPEERFGEKALVVTDPHGMELALVETAEERDFEPWPESPVPEAMQVRGIHGVRVWEKALGPTADFLTGAMGFSTEGEEEGWHRFGLDGGGSGKWIDIHERPNERTGSWGTGSIHHVAWRVPDEETQLEMRQRVRDAGRQPTEVIDRFWFKSVYFKEPGGVLFEIATDGPGFTVDEDLERLGKDLILPPWLEEHRERIETFLPPLRFDAVT